MGFKKGDVLWYFCAMVYVAGALSLLGFVGTSYDYQTEMYGTETVGTEDLPDMESQAFTSAFIQDIISGVMLVWSTYIIMKLEKGAWEKS